MQLVQLVLHRSQLKSLIGVHSLRKFFYKACVIRHVGFGARPQSEHYDVTLSDEVVFSKDGLFCLIHVHHGTHVAYDWGACG